jgi:hypothetical protein
VKRTMLLIACVAMVAIVAGATTAQAQMTKGVKAGLTMTTFTGDDKTMETIDPSYKMGFAVGGYLNHAFTPQFSFQPEAYFALKGAKYEEGSDSITVKLNYLSIPLLLKMQTNPDSGLFFVAGPEIAFTLSAKSKIDVGGESLDVDMKDDVKGMDYGLVVGAGVNLTKMSIEARYSMGLTTIDDTVDETDVKNSGFTVLFGIGL